MLYCRIVNSCDRDAFYFYSDIGYSQLLLPLCLVRDTPSGLTSCRWFVVIISRVCSAATVLPEVNPLKHDVPLTSRCRIRASVLCLLVGEIRVQIPPREP